MFWFNKEKPVETKLEEVKENPLRNRLRILFDNLCTLHDFNIQDDRLKVLLSRCYYNYNSTSLYRVAVNFKSNLGPVNISVKKETGNKITLDYDDENSFYFSIYCRDDISTIPAFSKQCKFNAEIVDLALYELEHYIQEKHLDKFSLESYNTQELNKLIEQSAERIKNKQ